MEIVVNVRALLARLKMSEHEFAREFGFPRHLVELWYVDIGRPKGHNLILLMLIERDPALVRETAQAMRRLEREAKIERIKPKSPPKLRVVPKEPDS